MSMVVPLHSFFFSTMPVAVAENKIFHMVTLILHEIWKIKEKLPSSQRVVIGFAPVNNKS